MWSRTIQNKGWNWDFLEIVVGEIKFPLVSLEVLYWQNESKYQTRIPTYFVRCFGSGPKVLFLYAEGYSLYNSCGRLLCDPTYFQVDLQFGECSAWPFKPVFSTTAFNIFKGLEFSFLRDWRQGGWQLSIWPPFLTMEAKLTMGWFGWWWNGGTIFQNWSPAREPAPFNNGRKDGQDANVVKIKKIGLY